MGERDARFFDEKRLQLGQVATELERAALKHDATQVTSFSSSRSHLSVMPQTLPSRRPMKFWKEQRFHA
jgi:hypothetical protein